MSNKDIVEPLLGRSPSSSPNGPSSDTMESPSKPQKPPVWETYLTFFFLVFSFTVGCFVNGFLWIACIDHLDLCYLSGRQMLRYLENFQREARSMSQAKIVAKFLQPPSDVPVVVVSYSVSVSQGLYRVQKIFVNHRSLYNKVRQHGLAVVMIHPHHPLSGLPSWEFQEILREQRLKQEQAWKPFVGFCLIAMILHYVICTWVWAQWIPVRYWWPLVVLSPLYHILVVVWLRQRQFHRFRNAFLSGTFAGPPDSWSLYVEVQPVFGDSGGPSGPSSQDDTAPDSRQTTTESVLVSEALFAVVGRRTYQSMAEVVPDVWSYVREHNLQESEDKLVISLDDKLSAVFGDRDSIDMFEMIELLKAHVD